MQSISATDLADLLGVSKLTLALWEKNGRFIPKQSACGKKIYLLEDVKNIPAIQAMLNSKWHEEENIRPVKAYSSIELFAGAGGLALGLENAGFTGILFNEIDHDACSTLRHNRNHWNLVEGDVRHIDFSEYENRVDCLSGGFPCQAFSYAGNKFGFEDIRGTLFFELTRAITQCRPKVFMAENVRGLLTHDHGRTIATIKKVIDEIGYNLVEPKVLRAIQYKVPQKRERLFLIGIRKDLAGQFDWPSPYPRVLTLRDAFYKGILYDVDVPDSIGQVYPQRKAEIMQHIPMGGYWRNLPPDLQREYMKKSFYLAGGKTGMARRLSLDEPSLTLTCAPAQNQTERCHPIETRPLTVREYARIQTFPDQWGFSGSLASQYKQIGNAVPVNLAAAVGRCIVRLLNDMTQRVG